MKSKSHSLQQIRDRVVQLLCTRYDKKATVDWEDFVQDALVDYWQKAPEEVKSNFALSVAYIKQDAIFRQGHAYRKAKRQSSLEKLSEHGFDPEVHEHLGENFEAHETLHTLLNQLSENIRSVVILHLDGYELKEIAEILTLSVDAVKQRHKRCIDKLKKMGGLPNSLKSFLPFGQQQHYDYASPRPIAS